MSIFFTDACKFANTDTNSISKNFRHARCRRKGVRHPYNPDSNDHQTANQTAC